MFGKTKILMYIVVVVAIINIVLNWFLIPIYGISGAAIATGISITILSFFELGYLYKISRIHPVKKVYIKIITIFVSLIAALYLIFSYIPLTFSLPAKVLIIILSYFLFFILLIIFNLFNKEDLLIIELIENKIGIKIPLIRRIIR
jgi:O-antigen/teichoic acid export membrane protein